MMEHNWDGFRLNTHFADWCSDGTAEGKAVVDPRCAQPRPHRADGAT